MFKKVLIANRGEIAVRVAHALGEMDIRSVAVYSHPDRGALHVACADEAYVLHGETSADTYLRGDAIIEIARQHGADAIHPGYGFLAENAAFAAACAAAGITFIGPSPETIRAMGDKVLAKRTMEAAGVPVVPGWSAEGAIDAGQLRTEARRVGYPVLIKAAVGGGGKGMRLVEGEDDLAAAVASAQREAKAAFGDDRVFLERYIPRARHIEFQIFGDTHGNAIHLFERECSIQRRHQKIIEEAPAPGFGAARREEMGEAAVRAAKAIGYAGAGTVEFMTEADGSFYFLEVNTRLQVEHPVTEMTVQTDLVRAQLLVAAGEPLPFRAEDLSQRGHAIECRIYAEDAERNFMPSTGVIERYVPPSGPGVRIDSGVTQGSTVSVHYDPLLAKLIVWGASRDEALARMSCALRQYVVLGVTTNIEFLRRVIEHEAFQAGDLHTGFLDEHRIAAGPDEGDDAAVPDEVLIAAAIAAQKPARSVRSDSRQAATAHGPWSAGGAWRIV